MKTALIDVGGGMKAVYGAGIYDFLMDNNLISFLIRDRGICRGCRPCDIYRKAEGMGP